MLLDNLIGTLVQLRLARVSMFVPLTARKARDKIGSIPLPFLPPLCLFFCSGGSGGGPFCQVILSWQFGFLVLGI